MNIKAFLRVTVILIGLGSLLAQRGRFNRGRQFCILRRRKTTWVLMTISIYKHLGFDFTVGGSKFDIFKILQTVFNILRVPFLVILNAKLSFQSQSFGLIFEFSDTTVFLQSP